MQFRAVASGGASGARPPHLKSVLPISRLAPWLLHTSNTAFSKCEPLLVFGPPCWTGLMQLVFSATVSRLLLLQ